MKQIGLLLLLILGATLAACGGGSEPPAQPTAAVQSTAISQPTSVQPTRISQPTAVQPTAAVAEPTNEPTRAVQTTEPAQANPLATADAGAPSGGGANTPPQGAPLDIVKKASLSAFDANSVRAVTLIEPADGPKSMLTLEYIKPDRLRVVQEPGGERIAIKGKGMWTKIDDSWKNEGAQAADFLFAFLDPKTMEDALQIIQVDSVQYVGPELLDGKATFVYTYKTVVDLGGTKANGVGKIWIGALDGRAYKGESTTESLVTPGKQDHTVVTYTFDLPLQIEEPK